MFESEDWNFDEEFSQDADDKALQLFSQIQNEEIEQPAKKQKLNECQSTNIMTNKILNEHQSVTSNSKHETNRVDTSDASRKNFVLGIFQQNSQKKDDNKIECRNQNTDNKSQKPRFQNISQNNLTSQRLNASKLENVSSQQVSRKNIVLDILKKKHVQNQTDNSSELSSSINNVAPLYSQNKKNINNVKSTGNHNTPLQKSNSYSQSTHKSSLFHNNETVNISSMIKNCHQEATVNEEHHRRSEESIKEVSKSLEQSITKNINDNKQGASTESRKHLLMKHLKPSILCNKEFINNVKHKSFTSKTEKQSIKMTTLVRKFPGPAGLLPDVIDNSTLSTSYLANLEDSNRDNIQDQQSTSLTEYCSQDTKALFSEGAWQMMLDDLPPGLLKNCEIAEIKEIASSNQQQCTKIPFLAGIIESIDYSHENPPIVLKDFTDRIEGIIHADIPSKYPGALDKNVVILLQNVGLLCISWTCISHKYHILISPSNLLAVYSHKGGIIRTPQMEHLKEKFCTIESSSMNVGTQQNDNCSTWQNSLNDASPRQKEKLLSKKDHCGGTFDFLQESCNSDFDSDAFLSSVNFEEVTDFIQNQKDVNSSILSVEEITTKEDKENIRANKTSSLRVSSDNPVKNLKEMELNCSDKAENINKQQNISIKSKLSAFKCKDVLTPAASNSESTAAKPVLQVNENKSADKQTHWTEDILCNGDNDSDDEMLSQLDVDSIF